MRKSSRVQYGQVTQLQGIILEQLKRAGGIDRPAPNWWGSPLTELCGRRFVSLLDNSYQLTESGKHFLTTSIRINDGQQMLMSGEDLEIKQEDDGRQAVVKAVSRRS
jgi:hypothetical protein